MVALYDAKDWKKIAQVISQRIYQERTSKQCRERWMHHIKMNISRSRWTESEAELLFKLQFKMGNKWSEILPFFPGKSQNDIKNFFNATVRRNIRRFNSRKSEDEKIKGSLDRIMKIPEVREILLLNKSLSKKFFKEKKLSVDSIDKIYEICGINLTEGSRAYLEDYNYQDYQGYQDLESLSVPNSDVCENEDAPYIDHAILWD